MIGVLSTTNLPKFSSHNKYATRQTSEKTGAQKIKNGGVPIQQQNTIHKFPTLKHTTHHKPLPSHTNKSSITIDMKLTSIIVSACLLSTGDANPRRLRNDQLRRGVQEDVGSMETVVTPKAGKSLLCVSCV